MLNSLPIPAAVVLRFGQVELNLLIYNTFSMLRALSLPIPCRRGFAALVKLHLIY